MFYLLLIYLFFILTTKSQIGLEKAKKTQLKVPKKWKNPNNNNKKLGKTRELNSRLSKFFVCTNVKFNYNYLLFLIISLVILSPIYTKP